MIRRKGYVRGGKKRRVIGRKSSVSRQKIDFSVLAWWYRNSDKTGKVVTDDTGWKRILGPEREE